MSSRYDNDSEDVVQENKKQTEAINKYIIGTLKMYINPEIFVKSSSGNTKKRKMPSIYYTQQYTKTPGEVQKIQKEITSEQAANKLASGSGSGSGVSGTSGITTGTGMGQPMQQQFQQPQLQQFQQPQLQQPQQQLVPQPVKVMGGGAEPMYGMGGVSGLNVQATSISSRVDPNAEPYIASLIKFSNAGFPPYSTIKSQVDTFFNLRAFRGFLKKLGNPVPIKDKDNKPINVENALGPSLIKDSDGKDKKVDKSEVENVFKEIFGNTSRDNTSQSSGTKEYTKDGATGKISFWSTNAVPQKIGKAFIFLYTIPSPQESRQQAQLSGQGRNLNANKPMMLMVKDGNDYSLIGGYVDNTIKNILGNTQVSTETETEVTKPDVITRTITKEFSSKTGTSFPQSVASKYLLYKISNYETKLAEFKSQLINVKIKLEEVEKRITSITSEVSSLKDELKEISRLIGDDEDSILKGRQTSLSSKYNEKTKELENEMDNKKQYNEDLSRLMVEINGINKNKEILPVIVYAVQVSQNTMQSIIQSSKSRTTLASGELVMVPIVTIYNVLSNKQVSDNIVVTKFQNQLLQMVIGILQQEKIISQIADASQITEDYYNKDARMEALQKILSPDSISEIDDIIKHNIKFMLGIFFSYKNSFSYSGNQYIINSVDWDDTFKQLSNISKLLKRMNASYYITLKLFLEKLEPGKLPSDRKGTFLESCGVKGAIIRNEWKNNFESRTLKEWKALLPIPSFGKGKGEGEGILNKIVPSFIKNALKSIQNPLMSPLDPGVLQVSLIQYSLLGEVELQEFYFKIENSFAGVTWKNDNTWEKRKQRLFAAMDECQADIYCFQNVQCSLDVYKKCVDEAVFDDEKHTIDRRVKILHEINNFSTYRERLNLYFNKIHGNLISTHDSEGLNCVSDIYEKYKDSYDFVYFFEQVFYKDSSQASGYIPNMLYPEYDKKVALGNLTMVKKSKFEIENKLRYDVRIGAAFCSENIKKKF